MQNKNRDIFIGCLAAVGCEVLFGLSYSFTKEATNITTPIALLGWRFVMAFVVINLMRLTGIIKINLNKEKIKQLIPVALLNPVIYFVGEVYGIALTTSSETGVFYGCFPIFSVLASILILKKKPEKRQVAGIFVTLCGVVTTVLAVGMSASFSPVGYGFLVLGLISYSLYSVNVEKLSGITDIEITYVMLNMGAAVYGAIAVIESLAHGNTAQLLMLPVNEPSFLIAIIYHSIGCSIGAFFLVNVAIGKIGVNKTASFIGVSTVVSIFAGIIAMGEAFTKLQIIGAAIIIGGVYIANFWPQKGVKYE